MQVKYSVSSDPWPRKPKPEDKRGWWKLNHSMRNAIGHPLDMMMALTSQHVISSWFSRPAVGYENFVCAQHIGADWDDETVESDIDIIAKVPFVAQHASFVYTTQSHTVATPRCRAIFVVEQPCYDPETHRRRTRAVAWALDSDMQATNPSRLFHGSGIDGKTIWLGNVIETAYLDHLVDEYDDCHRPKVYDTSIVESGALMAATLKHAREGNRNGVTYWCAKRLFENKYSRAEAEAFIADLHAQMDAEDFTLEEALGCVRSAYTTRR